MKQKTQQRRTDWRLLQADVNAIDHASHRKHAEEPWAREACCCCTPIILGSGEKEWKGRGVAATIRLSAKTL